VSDTPIYDALEREYLNRGQLNVMIDVLEDHLDSFEAPYFELMDEDIEEVPALLANAAKAVGNLLIPTLVDRQSETETDREFAAYIGGIIDTLHLLRTLPPPENLD